MRINLIFYIYLILPGCSSIKYPDWETVRIVESVNDKQCLVTRSDEQCISSKESCEIWFKKRATLVNANTAVIEQENSSNNYYGKYFKCENSHNNLSKSTEIWDNNSDNKQDIATEFKNKTLDKIKFKDGKAYASNKPERYTGKYEGYLSSNEKIETNFINGELLSQLFYKDNILMREINGKLRCLFISKNANGVYQMDIGVNNYNSGILWGTTDIQEGKVSTGMIHKRIDEQNTIHHSDTPGYCIEKLSCNLESITCTLTTGKETEYHSNGKVSIETSYKNGKKDGLKTSWSDDGYKKYEAHFKEGKEDKAHHSGIYKYIDPNGGIHYSTQDRDLEGSCDEVSKIRGIHVCTDSKGITRVIENYTKKDLQQIEAARLKQKQREYNRLVKETAKFQDDVARSRLVK